LPCTCMDNLGLRGCRKAAAALGCLLWWIVLDVHGHVVICLLLRRIVEAMKWRGALRWRSRLNVQPGAVIAVKSAGELRTALQCACAPADCDVEVRRGSPWCRPAGAAVLPLRRVTVAVVRVPARRLRSASPDAQPVCGAECAVTLFKQHAAAAEHLASGGILGTVTGLASASKLTLRSRWQCTPRVATRAKRAMRLI
jgi:hypothetical protein